LVLKHILFLKLKHKIIFIIREANYFDAGKYFKQKVNLKQCKFFQCKKQCWFYV